MRTSLFTPHHGRRTLNVRHLEAFYSVGVLGSVSAAAATLHLTQPAVSKQIAALEADVGHALFRREAGRLVMTAEARYLFDEVADMLAHLDRLADAMRNVSRLDVGTLEIGSPPGPSYALLPALVRDFVRERPGLSVNLRVDNSVDTLRAVSLQALDIAIVEEPTGESIRGAANYRVTPVEIACVCAVSASDPLANEAVVTPLMLDGKPAVTLERGHQLRERQAALMVAEGAALHARFEATLWWAALGLVRENLCYAVIDSINAEAFERLDGNRTVRFVPLSVHMPYRLALIQPTARQPSVAADAFHVQLLDALTAYGTNYSKKL